METIGEDLRQMIRTPLAAAHVEALRAAGRVVTYPKGTLMAQQGEKASRFVYVEEGEIEVVNPFTGERHYPSTIGPTQFMGEISLLYGGTASLPLRTVVDTRVIEVPRESFLTLMSQIPEMSDIIITVFAARRRRQIEDRRSGLYLIGEEGDRNVRRIAEFASRNRLPYTSVPLHSPEAEASAKSCAIDARTPAVIFGSKVPITDPTPDKIARLLGSTSISAATSISMCSSSVAGRPAWPRPFTRAPKVYARWSSRTSFWAVRRERRAESRTTWGFQPASQARTSYGVARCRP